MSPEQFAAMCRALPTAVGTAGVNELHDNVGEAFRKAQERNFAREADSSGTQWPPRKHRYPHPILRKTRRMITAATIKGAQGNIAASFGRQLRLGISGSGVPYAKFHQYGTIKLPVRQFFYLRSEDRVLLRPAVRSHLLAVFQQTKGRFRGK
jgi:phage virion morphogenesis protein